MYVLFLFLLPGRNDSEVMVIKSASAMQSVVTTNLLGRKNMLSHEVFDLLENSLAFGCLEKHHGVSRLGPGWTKTPSHIFNHCFSFSASSSPSPPSFAGAAATLAKQYYISFERCIQAWQNSLYIYMTFSRRTFPERLTVSRGTQCRFARPGIKRATF